MFSIVLCVFKAKSLNLLYATNLFCSNFPIYLKSGGKIQGFKTKISYEYAELFIYYSQKDLKLILILIQFANE